MNSTNLILLLILLLIILIGLSYYLNYRDGFLQMIRASTGKEYGVQETLPNPESASNKLASVESFIRSFKNYLADKYPGDSRVSRLNSRLSTINIEESELKPGVSSFTVNKGELISVCVRDKENPSTFHNHQLLQFVIIHELAHIASSSFGHNDEFNANFRWLLNEAQNIGYVPVDYSVNPVTYCGVNVTHNPIM